MTAPRELCSHHRTDPSATIIGCPCNGPLPDQTMATAAARAVLDPATPAGPDSEATLRRWVAGGAHAQPGSPTCLLGAFHNSLVDTVLRELDRVGALVVPPSREESPRA
jgi:hypothetical protein